MTGRRLAQQALEEHILDIVRLQARQGDITSSTADYGFHYDPYAIVGPAYWDQDGEAAAMLPDLAGNLDQDQWLDRDKKVYGWLVMMARNIVRKERQAEEERTAHGH